MISSLRNLYHHSLVGGNPLQKCVRCSLEIAGQARNDVSLYIVSGYHSRNDAVPFIYHFINLNSNIYTLNSNI
jgi:hypothetical protein